MPKPLKQPKVTEVLIRFLKADLEKHDRHPAPDLVERYLALGGPAVLETQVNVLPDGGERVETKRNTWTNGVYDWWHIRIPKNADTSPKWKDYGLSWPPTLHAGWIGATGWDWVNRCSR